MGGARRHGAHRGGRLPAAHLLRQGACRALRGGRRARGWRCRIAEGAEGAHPQDALLVRAEVRRGMRARQGRCGPGGRHPHAAPGEERQGQAGPCASGHRGADAGVLGCGMGRPSPVSIPRPLLVAAGGRPNHDGRRVPPLQAGALGCGDIARREGEGPQGPRPQAHLRMPQDQGMGPRRGGHQCEAPHPRRIHGHASTKCTEYYLRLTAELFPDIAARAEEAGGWVVPSWE